MAELVGGALLGAIVSELLGEVIKVAKVARRCKKNCEVLLATLKSISPLIEAIGDSKDNGNKTFEAWLESMQDLLTKAKSIVEKCSSLGTHNISKLMTRFNLSKKIIDINKQIREKLPEANLITVNIAQEIRGQLMAMALANNVGVDNNSTSKVQDIPSRIVPFVANPFERLKNVIMDVAAMMDAPMAIGLKGKGGAGKTLLAKMVNNDKDIQSKFETNSILWITIGRDARLPFVYLTMAKLIKDGGIYEQDFKYRNLEDHREYMLTAFKEKKVLLILDDVWDCYPANNCAMMEWLDVAKGVGSITLITTREMAVLNCGKAKKTVEVESLSKEDSWELFCIHAFGSMKPSLMAIESIAKEVCEECDGLPLAIKVIASAMYEKNDEGEWKKILKCLKGSTSMSHSKSVEKELEHKLYNRLKYSYEELDEESRRCFLYFAAFPEDYKIETWQLYCIWHVEGFFGSLNEEESKNTGQDVLIDLADRSLIDLSENGTIVMIHDVLRDLAIRFLRHAKPFEWAHGCFFKPGMVMETFFVIEKTVKRVSLMDCKIEEFPSNFELPFLEVCLLSSIESVNDSKELMIPKSFFLNMKALLMLDLSWCFSLKKLPESIKELKALLHLDLRRCEALKEIPENMGELKALTHLDLLGCWSLMTLPESMGELKSLTHLNLSGCESLKKVPNSMGKLTALTHLDLSGCYSLKEVPKSMGELKALKYLNLSGCFALKEVMENMEELKVLMHLNLSWCGSLKEVPTNIGELKALVHLDLSWCRCLKEVPKNMGEWKALTHLKLSGCDSLKEVPESIGELKTLVHLDLSRCSSLKKLPKCIGELKALIYLNLVDCYSLKEIPESIRELKFVSY